MRTTIVIAAAFMLTAFAIQDSATAADYWYGHAPRRAHRQSRGHGQYSNYSPQSYSFGHAPRQRYSAGYEVRSYVPPSRRAYRGGGHGGYSGYGDARYSYGRGNGHHAHSPVYVDIGPFHVGW